MPTRTDIITMAHRRIRVLSTDEAPTADMDHFGGQALDALFAELPVSDGIAVTWTLDATPQAAFLPLSYLLAVEIGPHYSMATETRRAAMKRLRAATIVDDRVMREDTDQDGVVSAEELADQTALYY